MSTRNCMFVLLAAMALFQVSGVAQTITYLDPNPMTVGWSANCQWEGAGLFEVAGSQSTQYKVTIYLWYDVDLTRVGDDDVPPAVTVTTDAVYGKWYGYVSAYHYECPLVHGRFLLRLLDMDNEQLATDEVATDTPDHNDCGC